MKAAFTILLTAVAGVLATPVPDEGIHRRFTCASRLQGYCHASNVNSRCEGGQFRSNAYQVCGDFCHC